MRRRWVKGIAVLVSVLLFASIVSGCGGGQKAAQPGGQSGAGTGGEVVELTLWHMEEVPQWAARFQEVFDRFAAANPDVKVKVQVLNWGTAWEKVLSAVQSGNQPDLLFTIPDFTTTVKETGVVQPVDDIVKELDEKHRFLDSAKGPFYFEDHYWSVPLYGMLQILWYRKDFFREAGLEGPPRTWDELVQYAEKLSADGRYGIAVPAGKNMSTDQTAYTFMVTAGAEDLFDASGNVRFDNPQTVKAFALYQRLVGLSPPDATSWGWSEPRDAFFNGTVAMAIEKGWYLSDWESATGKGPEDIGAAPVPTPADGKPGEIYIPNGVMLLTKDTKKREAARRLISFILDPQNYGRFVNAAPAQFLPLTETGFESQSWKEEPMIQRYAEQVQALVEQSNHGQLYGFSNGKVVPGISKISAQNLIAQAVQKMVVDGLPPQEAVTWGQQAMEEAVK